MVNDEHFWITLNVTVANAFKLDVNDKWMKSMTTTKRTKLDQRVLCIRETTFTAIKFK